MKKRSHYKPITPRIPMLVVMHQVQDLSLTERLSVEAFAHGYATTDHFDNLADCRDILTLAAAEKGDKQAQTVCELALHAMLAIQDRYARTQKMGTSGEELQALRLLADYSEDYWKRQGGAKFERAFITLKRARVMQKTGEMAV